MLYEKRFVSFTNLIVDSSIFLLSEKVKVESPYRNKSVSLNVAVLRSTFKMVETEEKIATRLITNK